MKKYILCILLATVLVACDDYKYPKNKMLSNTGGALVDSTANYLLDEIEFEGIVHNFAWNKEKLRLVNEYYSFTSEPLLYNYYLNRNIYRFVLEAENKAPLILSINKGAERSWITSKKIIEREQIAPACGIMLVRDYDVFTRDLAEEETLKFDSLFQAVDFYHLPVKEAGVTFVDYALVEAHEKGKYWVVCRSLDDSSLQGLFDYVVGLSRFEYNTDRIITYSGAFY